MYGGNLKTMIVYQKDNENIDYHFENFVKMEISITCPHCQDVKIVKNSKKASMKQFF